MAAAACVVRQDGSASIPSAPTPLPPAPLPVEEGSQKASPCSLLESAPARASFAKAAAVLRVLRLLRENACWCLKGGEQRGVGGVLRGGGIAACRLGTSVGISGPGNRSWTTGLLYCRQRESASVLVLCMYILVHCMITLAVVHVCACKCIVVRGH